MSAPTSGEPKTAAQVREGRRAPYRLGGSLPRSQHMAIILFGAVFNLIAVTLGLHGAFGVSLPAAIGGALALSLIQTLIFEEVFRNGALLGFLGSVFYLLIVSLNVVLAAGGITAALGADVLGQNSFRASVAQPLADIRAVTSFTSHFAAAMAGVATHSSQQRAIETARGGTCMVSGPGNGPISRLREDDAASFSAARETMQEIATEGQRITSTIESVVANYTVSRHDEVVQAISVALGRAQQLARDPRVGAIRAMLQERAAQIGSGRPDRLDPSVRVLCPRDTLLREVIAQALAIAPPQAPADFDTPPVPSEASSVWGLIGALGGVLFGDGGDLGPWRLSIALAPVPDGFLIYGLLLHRRQRKGHCSHQERLADDLGLPPGTDPESAIERALQSPRMKRLYESHVRAGRFFSTDYLVVPLDETARRHALCRMDGKTVFDGGIWRGSLLPIPTRGLALSAEYQLFALAKGIWARMEAEEIRAALADLGFPEPHGPSPVADVASAEERAA